MFGSAAVAVRALGRPRRDLHGRWNRAVDRTRRLRARHRACSLRRVFWVFNNRNHKYATVHRSDCTFCRAGRGVHGVGGDSWRGPFDTFFLASRFRGAAPYEGAARAVATQPWPDARHSGTLPSGPMIDDPTFTAAERARAAAWKKATAALPPEAKVPAAYVGKDGVQRGPEYEFCLPAEHAALSLLPEVRDLALALFAELGIPWHAGVNGGPGNHLLSSQVQCVNALGQMVVDPSRIINAFGPILGTETVHEIEPGRWLTFEYIGSDDHLNEAVKGKRTRGAHCTSVDAAFVHRTREGIRELVLIEWKYTESYGPRTVVQAKDSVRRERYGKLLAAPDSPIAAELLPFEELLQEPLYQLMRQQLLAHELEKANAHGVDRVRVVHVLPEGNAAYHGSLHGVTAHQLGSTVKEVWNRLLRRPDRFVPLDNAVFLDPAITSQHYVERYGDALSANWRSDG